MSKLNVDQKTIKELLQNKKSDFLIPDYQRPYAWEEDECKTLWDDILAFAVPDDGHTDFDTDSEYFLGPIVTFRNNNEKLEVIDGQQRLTTIMLLLRAFYAAFGKISDENSIAIKQDIEKCLWKTNEFGKPDTTKLKIDSEVASDNDKDEFLNILKTGVANFKLDNRYSENYRFFQKCIADFKENYSIYFAFFPVRLLNNCILLPIEAESQDTALRIFSTLNDRGLPLSDADIFKAQLYKYFSDLNKKDEFIAKWKDLESLCHRVFRSSLGSPLDELFTRYMYYIRAMRGITKTTTESLRKFYEKNSYELLKSEETFNNLIVLADFWEDVSNQDSDRFSDRILRCLFILNYAPNGMWTYFVSVYFMKNKDEQDRLEESKFFAFLDKIIGFIWAYAIVNPGVNALRAPVYQEMINIINDKPVDFAKFKFDEETLRKIFATTNFNNGRPITKSMVTWWAFEDKNQQLLSLDTVLEIEHIYARKRYEIENSLENKNSLESLGNKALLEKRINIRASDYHFEDKKRLYKGENGKGQQIKDATKIYELLQLADTAKDFTLQDITQRYTTMVDKFVDNLKRLDLILAS